MAPHIESMRKRISELLETSIDNINVKATTTEKLGFTGREELLLKQLFYYRKIMVLIRKMDNHIFGVQL